LSSGRNANRRQHLCRIRHRKVRDGIDAKAFIQWGKRSKEMTRTKKTIQHGALSHDWISPKTRKEERV